VVKIAREASGPSAVLSLNQPEPMGVESHDGRPVTVLTKRNAVRPVTTAIMSIEDIWRVEEEWWRDSPIVRTYFEVLLDTGRRMTLFFDHGSSSWYSQRHG
jgi:hypothetical protein